MTNTPGRRKLRAYLKSEAGMNQTQLARALGCSQPSLFAWVAGTSRPREPFRRALETLIGIPFGDWLKAEERRYESTVLKKTGTEA